MAGGRPSVYTAELGHAICSKIAGGKSLKTICELKSMPSKDTVFSWFGKHPEFTDNYARATEERTEALVEDMLDIADDPTVEPNRSRLMVDTRKWIASKLKPKKYGDKLQQEHSGSLTLERLITASMLPDDKSG